MFDQEASKDEVNDARYEVLEEIAEAKHERDDKTYFLEVWQKIEEATLIAYKQGDYELYDFMKNNWELMKLHAEKNPVQRKRLQP
ncbi:hypothetical protein [Haloarcula vallismortis]|uniref:hypothetical protein n=1 Tax=Haloarcula vallismortis TaxID=28442 RepID=UPI000321873F|nr:hypothetical protein [Haloarcula vallismortis]